MREGLGEAVHLGIEACRDIDRIGAGRLVDGDERAGRLVEAAIGIGGFGAKFDAADIADAHEGAVRIGAHHDILEFFHRDQAALRLDIELEELVLAHRLRADAADRRLDVLRLAAH